MVGVDYMSILIWLDRIAATRGSKVSSAEQV